MSKRSASKHMSVQAKINLALAGVFALVLVAALYYSPSDAKHLGLPGVTQQPTDSAASYF